MGYFNVKSEKEHIEGLIKGSYKDFSYLYELYASQLFAFIFKLTRSKNQTEEIIQETFIKIWFHRSQINPEQSFKSYLFTIARNLVLNELRRQINHPVFSDYIEYCNMEELSENKTEQKLDFDEFNNRLQEGKRKLTPRQQEIFELNKEYGLSVQEIATRISISEQSVRNQLSAALQELKKEMKDYYFLFFLLFLS